MKIEGESVHLHTPWIAYRARITLAAQLHQTYGRNAIKRSVSVVCLLTQPAAAWQQKTWPATQHENAVELANAEFVANGRRHQKPVNDAALAQTRVGGDVASTDELRGMCGIPVRTELAAVDAVFVQRLPGPVAGVGLFRNARWSGVGSGTVRTVGGTSSWRVLLGAAAGLVHRKKTDRNAHPLTRSSDTWPRFGSARSDGCTSCRCCVIAGVAATGTPLTAIKQKSV